jgi:type IV secretion system protein VirB10
MTIAQVTENAYDTVTGEHLLIPQGTRLIGKYDSVVAFGQKRALLVWNRIILPNGDSIVIDNLPATDAAGYAGLEDEVDFHTWQLLKGIGRHPVGSERSSRSATPRAISSGRCVRAFSRPPTAGQRLIERQSTQPTINVRGQAGPVRASPRTLSGYRALGDANEEGKACKIARP